MQEQQIKQIKRIAKYKRCSTSNQELTLQDETLEKHIQRMREDNVNIDYVVTDYSDEGVSGKNADRPALTRLLKDIDKRLINCVVIVKLDRLGRSLQDLLHITNDFKDKGVDFIIVEQNIDTSTPQGVLMFQMLGAFAEFERVMIYERMQAGRKRAKELGSRSGKPCHRPKIKIDEEGVIHRYENGISMNQIAKFYEVSITPIRRILKSRGKL